MSETAPDPQHFIRAVTQLGHRRPVLATRTIFSVKGAKLADPGVQLDAAGLARLSRHPLLGRLEDSLSCPPMLDAAILRRDTQSLLESSPFLKRLTAEQDTRDLLLDALERIPLPEPIAFQLTLSQEVHPELYQHLLWTAVVAAWLAARAGLPRFHVGSVAASGLLHDLGLLHLDPALLEHKHDLNHSQRRQLYAHPILSTVLIECHPVYAKEMVRAVMEHHEFIDGSGYPGNLAGVAISPFGRILALAELIVGALASAQPAAELRLSMLLRMNRHRYDESLTDLVVHALQPERNAADLLRGMLAEPVHSLIRIDEVILSWPRDLLEQPGLSKRQQDNLGLLSLQVLQLHRTLARVGVAPEQLRQLGPVTLDRQLQAELTLLAGEAAWQLQTLARQVRRRWNTEPGTSLPARLQAWLNDVDSLVFPIFKAIGKYAAQTAPRSN